MLINCNIRKVFFDRLALNLVAHFHAETGLICIDGRNGVGKTTLLKTISGIYSYQGNCSINGTSIQSLSTLQKRQRSYCPDSYQFSELITPYQYLNFIAEVYAIKFNDWIFDEAKALGLEKSILKTKKIIELSYGMRKKVLILSVLMTNSKITLMDEPLNGLDEIGKSYLEKHIKDNMSDNLFIMTCHDKRWIKQFEPQVVELL